MAEVALPALSITGPQPTAGGTINPFEAMNTIANIGRTQAETNNILLQQRGQQRFSDIMAQAPDRMSGFNAALQDPVASAYAGDAMDKYGRAMADQRAYNQSVTEGSQTATQAAMRAVAESNGDPDLLNQRLDMEYSQLSPEVQKQAAFAFGRLREAYTGGLEGLSPEAAQEEVLKRQTSIGMGGGLTPEVIRNINGLPPPSIEGTMTLPSGQIVPTQTRTDLFGRQQVFGYNPATGTMMPSTAPQAPSTAAASGPLTGPGSAVAAPATGGALAVPPPAAGGAPGGGLTAAGGVLGGGTPPPAGGAPAPAQTWLTPQTTGQKGETEMEKDIQTEANTDAAAIPGLLDTMDTVQGALKQFYGGPGAGSRLQAGEFLRAAGSWANALGMNVDQSKINSVADGLMGGQPGSLAAAQEFRALIRSYAVNQLKQAAQGTGRVMLPEVQAFMEAINIEQDPRAIMNMINTRGRWGVQRGIDRLDKWPVFRQQVQSGQLPGRNISEFPAWYTSQMGPNEKLPLTTQGGRYIGPMELDDQPHTMIYRPGSGLQSTAPTPQVTPQAPLAQ